MKKFKKGFTLIEIVIVIAIIGALMALFGNKLFSFFEKTGLQTTVNQDIDTIMKAAMNYKSNSPLSGGTFKGISAHQLAKYLSDKMGLVENNGAASNGVDDGTEVLTSMGLAGGCVYRVAPDGFDANGDGTIDAGTVNYGFQIFADCSTDIDGAGALYTSAGDKYNWTARSLSQMEDVVMSGIQTRSKSDMSGAMIQTAQWTAGDDSSGVTSDATATGYISATAGSEEDGMVQIRFIVM